LNVIFMVVTAACVRAGGSLLDRRI
jgi:hypothetical protein